MAKKAKRWDLFLLLTLIAVLAAIPVGITQYDYWSWKNKIPTEAKTIALTAHSKAGWVPGRLSGLDMLTMNDQGVRKPLVIVVKKGDLVVFKLTSSDVIHGFSLKEFGIFIEDGVRPGKVTLAIFKADKVGRFTFSCNIICGGEHENMQGILYVKI